MAQFAPEGRRVERRLPAVVCDCSGGAVLQEEVDARLVYSGIPFSVYRDGLCNALEGSFPPLVLRIWICTFFKDTSVPC